MDVSNFERYTCNSIINTVEHGCPGHADICSSLQAGPYSLNHSFMTLATLVYLEYYRLLCAVWLDVQFVHSFGRFLYFNIRNKQSKIKRTMTKYESVVLKFHD